MHALRYEPASPLHPLTHAIHHSTEGNPLFTVTNVLYDRLTTNRRIRLHQRIGERTAAGYRARTGEIAAALAMHFEKGQNHHRAVLYLQQAGENALRKSAHREAINLLSRGLELLQTLPNTPERLRQELTLQSALGPALSVTKGYGALEVATTYAWA